MSDPISVTGTVIGIVSLGLSLCQGLVDYLGALKCRREEIESTYQQINGLQSSFSVIKAVLPKLRTDYQASGQVVRNHLRLCEDEIHRLTQLLDEFKHHDSPSGSLNMRVQFQAKKLLYPFRQGNIHRLEKWCTETQWYPIGGTTITAIVRIDSSLSFPGICLSR
jgi:hypothetical protein